MRSETSNPVGAARRRLGPRPLPLHLAVAALTWSSSQLASSGSSSGSPPWRPSLRQRAAALESEIASRDPEAFAAALGRETVDRGCRLLAAIETYRRHPYRRDLADPPVIWREGGSRLLDYGAENGPAGGAPLLVVPSLINRAYILDLTAGQSFLRWLAGAGFRPLLLDWGAPGAAERGYGLEAYIAGRLSRALDAAAAAAGQALPVIGYCMGGTLALALAQLRPDAVSGLAVLATPWDFHAGQGEIAKAGPAALSPYKPVMQALGVLPTDALQAMFAGLDPMLVIRKFLKFAELDPASPQAETFVALEDWLNDGVPLSAPVAEETLEGWYGRNDTAAGQWRIGGVAVDPARVAQPSLAILPSNDRIVPPASAAAMAAALPRCRCLQPRSGHIGLMASARARAAAWQPLAAWLKEEVL